MEKVSINAIFVGIFLFFVPTLTFDVHKQKLILHMNPNVTVHNYILHFVGWDDRFPPELFL